MAALLPTTPRRIYSNTNICRLCAFSFLVTEVSSDGVEEVTKLFNKKLKLTQERVDAIQAVLSFGGGRDREGGVCIPCFSKVEKVGKYRRAIDALVTELRRKRDIVTSTTTPSKAATPKRSLRSPQVSIPPSKLADLKSTPKSTPTLPRSATPFSRVDTLRASGVDTQRASGVVTSPIEKRVFRDVTNLPIACKYLEVS
jgi:hypothetical protein